MHYLNLYIEFKLHLKHYWRRRNVPFVEPRFIFGNMIRLNFLDSFSEVIGELYTENSDKGLVGIWLYRKPVLMITDAKLVKQILIKDFDHFHDRVDDADEKFDALDGKYN